MVLSDNSLAFTGRKLGSVVLIEKNLISLGIKPILNSSRHPPACGENERGHHTARRWLGRRRPRSAWPELQQLLDCYREKFNHHIAASPSGATPLEQRAASTPDHSSARVGTELSDDVSTHTATSHGAIMDGGVIVGLGVEYAVSARLLQHRRPRPDLLQTSPGPLGSPSTVAATTNTATPPRPKAAHPPPVTHRPHTPRFLHRCQPSRRAGAVQGGAPHRRNDLDRTEHRHTIHKRRNQPASSHPGPPPTCRSLASAWHPRRTPSSR